MSTLLDRIKHDIVEDIFFTQNFPNDGQRFLAWYLLNVYRRTPIQTCLDITDGPNDKEIDAVLVDDDKQQVIIIQSKFYGGSVDHQPLQEILTAWQQMRDLARLQEGANAKLKVKLAEVSEALNNDYEIVFEFLTTGQLTDSARHDLISFQNIISDSEHPSASLTLVDEPIIQSRWDDAMAHDLPKISHSFRLEPGQYLKIKAGGFQTILAAVPLADCLTIPHINDGLLFRKNVRQSLGISNKVNKGLKQTLSGDSPNYFFLFHNGITALCEKMRLDTTTNQLHLEGLSVVNGCQSLNTILACSEKVRATKDAHILFRFYEIPQNDLADKISVNTNAQSAVKPRDLRSNDKRLVAIKRAYETKYKDGFFLTKRGEIRPADKDKTKSVDVALFAKTLMAWHCQRPNVAYNENAIFDKHFDKLFHDDYLPEDVMALNAWMQHIDRQWDAGVLSLDDALMAAPSYCKFHLLYAVQSCFCAASSAQLNNVPIPSATIRDQPTSESILTMAALCFNGAFTMAYQEAQQKDKVFSPQNWLKNNDSRIKVDAAVHLNIGFIAQSPFGPALKSSLTVPAAKFVLRWQAD